MSSETGKETQTVDWYNPTPEQVQSEIDKRSFIKDDALYFTLLRWGIINSPDVILVRTVNEEKQFGLARRTAVPWKGEFCLFGRELKPGREPLWGAKFTCQRELGFSPEDKDVQFVGHLSVLNPERIGFAEPWFSLWHIHTVTVHDTSVLRLLDDNEGLEWFSRIQPSMIDPVKKALRMAGFSE